MCVSCVNAQLPREEGCQKSQPPLYSVEHPSLPAPFPVLWEPVRDPGILQGKAVQVPCSHFCLCWRMKRKTEPAHGHACYPQDVLPTNQKTFKHLSSTNMIKPLSSLNALKQHWGHNTAFGLNIKVDLQTAGPLETVNGNNFVSRWQSQPLPNCFVLQPSRSQAHTNQLFNVGMSWRSSTHLSFPSSGAVYPHLLHGPYLWFIAIISDFRVTMWRPYVLVWGIPVRSWFSGS